MEGWPIYVHVNECTRVQEVAPLYHVEDDVLSNLPLPRRVHTADYERGQEPKATHNRRQEQVPWK